MKTWSKILTDGARIPLVDRNVGKSSRNGSGIFAWSWDKTALPPHCAPLPLLQPEPALTSGPASTNEAPSAIEPAPTSGPTLANEPGYGSPQWARPSFTEGFPGSAFLPQADGTL